MTKSVDELLAQYQAKFVKGKPIPSEVVDPQARVLDALQAGEQVVCMDSFKSDGVLYSAGDLYPAALDNVSQVARLAKYGHVLPAKEVAIDSLHFQLGKFFKNNIEPVQMQLNQARGESVRKAAKVAELEAALKHAESELRDARAIEKDIEKKLREVLEGPDVTQLLS
jgi:hypothetical protein